MPDENKTLGITTFAVDLDTERTSHHDPLIVSAFPNGCSIPAISNVVRPLRVCRLSGLQWRRPEPAISHRPAQRLTVAYTRSRP